jgi:hypothetical protein
MPRADDMACPRVRPKVATAKETLCLIEGQQPLDRGIGYVNGALLSSARLQTDVTIYTRKRRLKKIAGDPGLGAMMGLRQRPPKR